MPEPLKIKDENVIKDIYNYMKQQPDANVVSDYDTFKKKWIETPTGLDSIYQYLNKKRTKLQLPINLYASSTDELRHKIFEYPVSAKPTDEGFSIPLSPLQPEDEPFLQVFPQQQEQPLPHPPEPTLTKEVPKFLQQGQLIPSIKPTIQTPQSSEGTQPITDWREIAKRYGNDVVSDLDKIQQINDRKDPNSPNYDAAFATSELDRDLAIKKNIINSKPYFNLKLQFDADDKGYRNVMDYKQDLLNNAAQWSFHDNQGFLTEWDITSDIYNAQSELKKSEDALVGLQKDTPEWKMVNDNVVKNRTNLNVLLSEKDKFEKKRISNIDSQIKERNLILSIGYNEQTITDDVGMKQVIKVSLTENEKKSLTKEVKDLETQKRLVFQTPDNQATYYLRKYESELTGLIANGTISQNQQPLEALKDYYLQLWTEHEELRKKIDKGYGTDSGNLFKKAGGVVDWVLSNTIAYDKDSDLARYTEVNNILKSIAPVALLNRPPSKKEGGGLVGVFLKSTGETLFPANAASWNPTKQQIFSNTLKALNQLGIANQVSEDVDGFIKMNTEVQPWSGESIVQTMGLCAGFVLPFMAGGTVTGVGIKGGIKVAEIAKEMIGITKLGKTTELAINYINTFAKTKTGSFISSSVKRGLQFETTGQLFKGENVKSQAQFEQGFFGGIVGGATTAPLGAMLNGIFGKVAPKAVAIITNYANKGMGEYGSEMAEQIVQAYTESDNFDMFKKSLTDQFGSISSNLFFFTTTFMMGITMGGSSEFGQSMLGESKYYYNNVLTDEDKGKADKIIGNASEDFNNSIDKSVSDTKTQIENEGVTVEQIPPNRIGELPKEYIPNTEEAKRIISELEEKPVIGKPTTEEVKKPTEEVKTEPPKPTEVPTKEVVPEIKEEVKPTEKPPIKKEKSPEQKYNDLVDDIVTYNGMTLAQKKRASALYNRIGIRLNEEGIKFRRNEGTFKIADEKGFELKLRKKPIAGETKTSEVEEFIPKVERTPQVQEYIDKFIKQGEENPQFLMGLGFGAGQKEIPGILKDIAEGKNTKRANDFMNKIEEYSKEGRVIVTEGSGINLRGKSVPIDEYFKVVEGIAEGKEEVKGEVAPDKDIPDEVIENSDVIDAIYELTTTYGGTADMNWDLVKLQVLKGEEGKGFFGPLFKNLSDEQLTLIKQTADEKPETFRSEIGGVEEIRKVHRGVSGEEPTTETKPTEPTEPTEGGKEPTESASEDEVLGIVNQNIGFEKQAKVGVMMRRYFKPGGNLPRKAFYGLIKRDSKVNSTIKEMVFIVRDFNSQFNKEYKGQKTDVKTKAKEDINGFLLGEKDISVVPESLQESVNLMRLFTDKLSNDLKKSGLVTGDLHAIFDENEGIYLNRSYEIHDNPRKWKKFIRETKDGQQLYNQAKNYLKESYKELLPGVVNVEDEISGILTYMLDKNMTPLTGRAKSGMDLGILKKRLEIAPEIRAFMGEYQDPVLNFARSVYKMTNLLETYKTLKNIADIGLKEGWLKSGLPSGEQGLTAKIAQSGNKALEPIAGKDTENQIWTTPEIAEAFNDYLKNTDAISWEGKLYSGINGFLKFGKTVLSPTAHERNFISNALIAVANGHFGIHKFKDSVQAIIADLNVTDNKVFREKVLAYIKRGIIGEGVHYGELRAFVKEASKYGGVTSAMRLSRLQKLIKAPVDVAQAMYRAEDDFWKIYGFENEVSDYKKAFPNKDIEAIKDDAARRVRNTYPTFSMVPRIIQMIRRNPLLGAFPSFPAEIVRTRYNTLELAIQELKVPETRSIGAKRILGTAIALSCYAGLGSFSKYLYDWTKDEMTAIYRFTAPWMEELIPLSINKDGIFRYIDFSYSDPHNTLIGPVADLLRNLRNPDNVNLDEATGKFLLKFFEPFLGVEILAKRLAQAYLNKKENGKEIVNTELPMGDQLHAKMMHVLEALEPGILNNFQRIYKSMKKEGNDYGNYDTFSEFMTLFTGQRIAKMDVSKNFVFNIRNYVKKYNKDREIYSDALYKKLSEEDVNKEYQKADELAKQSTIEIINDFKAAVKLGVPEDKLKQILNTSGLSKMQQKMIISGNYIPLLKQGEKF